jgi:hypothetical protein
MAEQDHPESPEPGVRDTVARELDRLLGLVKRLENENASLRRELANTRPSTA